MNMKCNMQFRNIDQCNMRFVLQLSPLIYTQAVAHNADVCVLLGFSDSLTPQFTVHLDCLHLTFIEMTKVVVYTGS